MPRIVLKDVDTNQSHEVSATEATLGRDPACSIYIAGPKSRVVSARHARVFFQDGAWWIEDTSRNGTVLDQERLQVGQRHAIKVGQIIGLGESGPRLKVLALESRAVAETIMEKPGTASVDNPGDGTGAPSADEPRTAAMRRSEMVRAGLKVEEPTEPMSPSPDWLVHVVLRAANTNVRFDVRASAVTIGRAPDCDIQVPPELGASVSRSHAQIAIQEGGVVVRDAGSRNGTFVNGVRLAAPHPASRNDEIMLGSGGPTFAIEELHIVKGQPSAPSISAIASLETAAVTPPPKSRPRAPGRPIAEPPTAPAPFHRHAAPKAASVAPRSKLLLWVSVAIAAAVLAMLAFR